MKNIIGIITFELVDIRKKGTGKRRTISTSKTKKITVRRKK